MYCGHKLREGSIPPSSGDRETEAYIPTGADLDDDTALDPDPESIGGYRLLRQIGKGGMGVVYEAEPPGGGSRVAVKVLAPRQATSQTAVDRFRQEGRLASQLAHPRCVFVLAADTDAGRPYIVMELMPGRTLKDLVEAEGRLAPDVAVAHILDVIDGLAEAHRVGMIHRDIKPSNCFLTADGRVKVGDFGLSKSLAAGDRHLTQSGTFLGTVLFASPEQIRGEPLDYTSDVYSVCATLYYLLAGEAPYHHESLTAALAKAISEPPVPIREKQPDVSRGLEAVIMRGLERDRDRRWHSLDDLREALVSQLPSRRHVARPRAVISAYLLDRIVIAILTVPALVVLQWANLDGDNRIEVFEPHWLAIAIMIGYFAILEGVFGVTPGKWLLGLRVSRLGQASPPGVSRAIPRTIVFHSLFFGVAGLPQQLIVWIGPQIGGSVGGFAFIACLAGLLVQLRKKWGHRGFHDFATGCHVTQQPLPIRKLRLRIQQPTPLQVLLPTPEEPLPGALGGYTIRGRIAVQPSSEQVWLGEDGSLSRRVLIWLKPDGCGEFTAAEASRPSRLRRLSRGTLRWAGQDYEWIAFAAPLGGPLRDTIAAQGPLPWADARFLLEQLVEEFRAAQSDGTMPPRLGLDQVWVERNGRIELLDCSLANGATPSQPPLGLVREVASLALEGRPRCTQGMIRAPVPPHAAPILHRLFTNGGYPTLADLQRELNETQNHRPEVTPAIRAAQMGIQAAVVGIGWLLMFVLTFGTGLILILSAINSSIQVEEARAALANPEKRAALADRPELAGALKNPNAPRRLDALQKRLEDEIQARRATLFSPQRMVLEQYEEHALPELRGKLRPSAIREAIQWAGAPEHSPRGQSPSPWSAPQTFVFIVLLIIPIGMVTAAAVLRGGLSLLLAGIALVRADGGKATRRQCALRSAVVWFPITALLYGSAAVQVFAPERAYAALGLEVLALALLPVYVAIALRFPSRAPQDRVTGTYLVPA